ncbi:MAG: hypothetical protein KA792_04090 [Bacteroidales bacterium]|nr:hypothetical protein [Bacteroidales bacterium]
MSKQDYVMHQDALLKEQFRVFQLRIEPVKTQLGLTDDDLAPLFAFIVSFFAALEDLSVKQNAAQAAAQAKDLAKKLTVTEFRRLVRMIKSKPAYNNAIGEDLGIEGAVLTFDPYTMKPVVSNIIATLTKVIIDWVKGPMDGVEIWCAKRILARDVISDETQTNAANAADDASGLKIAEMPELIWEKLDTDYRSPWEDTRFNLTNKPETRYYKLVYIYKDKPTGVESDPVKVITEIYQR